MENFNRIADDVTLGKDVVIHGFGNLYGCVIGDRTKIGTFVEIQKKAVVGRDCKISSHSFICEGVTLEDGVFIGHHVVFINDKYPSSRDSHGKMKTDRDWKVIFTKVEEGASIGSGSTILCGVTIGRNAIIGAGSVVTHSVPAGETWVGNPARLLKKAKKGI